MIHHVYDHNYGPWHKRMRSINGAYTYSVDICEHYLPYLDATLKNEGINGRTVVSTCALIHKQLPHDVVNDAGRFDTLVQFLHSYPHNDPTSVVRHTVSALGHKFDRFIFVVAYKAFADEINAMKDKRGSARFLPMRIGTLPDVTRQGPQRKQAVWFGNVYESKKETHVQALLSCEKLGVELLTITRGKLYKGREAKGRSVSQAQAWQLCANAGIVFAVGRCALEAYAMDCHVIIAGDRFGGVAQNADDWIIQESTNFNTRIHTGDFETIAEALGDALDQVERGNRYMIPFSIRCNSLIRDEIIQW